MRLTNTIKEAIVSRMLDSYKSLAEITKVEDELRELCVKAALAKIPPLVLDAHESFSSYINVANSIYMKDANGNSVGSCVKLLKAIPSPASWYLTVASTEEMGVLSDRISKLKEARAKLKLELKQVVNTCTTDKQLIATLPEAEKFIPHDFSGQLPIPVESINKLRMELALLAKAKQ